jgi:hypothetical protein
MTEWKFKSSSKTSSSFEKTTIETKVHSLESEYKTKKEYAEAKTNEANEAEAASKEEINRINMEKTAHDRMADEHQATANAAKAAHERELERLAKE